MTIPTSASIQWMVSARAKIACGLAALYELHREYDAALQLSVKANNAQSRPCESSYLTGIAFSLWRAAFLFYDVESPTRSPKDILLKQEMLLLQLTKDNSASYATETGTREWMGGFHLNNARFRIEILCDLMSIPARGLKEPRLDAKLDKHWNLLFKHFMKLLKKHQTALESHSATGKTPTDIQRRKKLFDKYFKHTFSG